MKIISFKSVITFFSHINDTYQKIKNGIAQYKLFSYKSENLKS